MIKVKSNVFAAARVGGNAVEEWVMEDYRVLIRTVLERGKAEDAGKLLEICIRNAFPTFHFRGLELTELDGGAPRLTGKSLHHSFVVEAAQLEGHRVWAVYCHRTSAGKTPDKQIYLDYDTLNFVQYMA